MSDYEDSDFELESFDSSEDEDDIFVELEESDSETLDKPPIKIPKRGAIVWQLVRRCSSLEEAKELIKREPWRYLLLCSCCMFQPASYYQRRN